MPNLNVELISQYLVGIISKDNIINIRKCTQIARKINILAHPPWL
jgi:hypothetical protein